MEPKVISSVAGLSNDELLARVKHLAQREREATASLIAHLAELDERRLYLAEGFSSLFTYCTRVLHLSEHAAYRRIEAARTARRFPVLLPMLEDGTVNLTTVGLLAAHLTSENHREVLNMVRHKSKRQVEEVVARLRPQPSVPSSVRKVPAVCHASTAPPTRQNAAAGPPLSSAAPGNVSPEAPLPAVSPPRAHPAVVIPLAPERYRVQFTASAETYEKLRLAQDLLRHQIPDGNPAQIFDLALTALLQEVARKKVAATESPRGSRKSSLGSRHIPADVKRAVWLRDGGRCVYVAASGRRCAERGFLEFHHVTPFTAGVESTVGNIQLRCRAHNGHEAELYFGSREPRGVREIQAPYLALSPVIAAETAGHRPGATRSGPTAQSDCGPTQSDCVRNVRAGKLEPERRIRPFR